MLQWGRLTMEAERGYDNDSTKNPGVLQWGRLTMEAERYDGTNVDWWLNELQWGRLTMEAESYQHRVRGDSDPRGFNGAASRWRRRAAFAGGEIAGRILLQWGRLTMEAESSLARLW